MYEQEQQRRPIAVITGASRGIGRAISIAFAEAGIDVVVNYKTHEQEAHEVVLACERAGGKAIAVCADVSREEEVAFLFTSATQLGMPSILVNNAGVDDYGLLMDLPTARWQTILDVNLTGAFLCSRQAIPYLARSENARMINIASIHGINGASCEAAYAASKGGLIALTKSLAKELGGQGITVNAVAPGIIETDMIQRFDDEELSAMKDATPLGRLGKPSEVAHLVRFLVSQEASFITGQIISPNGGLLT